MRALCAAIGSFHAKSATTYLVMVRVTVRILPLFLTLSLIRWDTLFVSTLGVRSYKDQRYWLTHLSVLKHSLGVSTLLMARVASSLTESEEGAETSCNLISGSD